MSSSHSTPAKVASVKAGSKPKASSSSRSSSNKFTPAMQERQARNKDPYSSSDESSDSAWEGQNKRFFDTYGKDSVLKTQRRREAAIVLDNPELLMMHAQARFDSIPGTRHYYTKILCGFEDEHDPYREMLRNRQAEKTDREPAKEPTKAKRSP